MPVPMSAVPIALDVTTLFVVATCVTGLLGLLLLAAWARNRIPALAWWGAAYLVGGFSVALWNAERLIAPTPDGIGNAMLFIACGMMWNAARVFHGRPVLVSGLIGGACIWLFACAFADFAAWPDGRIVLSSAIIAGYTFATAAELSRERRKRLRRRWPAIFVPMLHGAVFLFPLPLASVLPGDSGTVLLSTGWVALFVLEIMLYAVGTAFIVLVLANERSMRIHRDAAMTDELTGVLNRRGVLQAAPVLMAQQARRGELVSVLMFDLDHFKSINDQFGHAVGDKALHLFASTASAGTRATDIVGRFGGEEFVAILPGGPSDAKIVAERVRAAFQAAGVTVDGRAVDATVSVGAASGVGGADLVTLLSAADAALYRAKSDGRNRVEIQAEIEMPAGGATMPVAGDRAACAAAMRAAASKPLAVGALIAR